MIPGARIRVHPGRSNGAAQELDAATIFAIRRALATERNPNHLIGFAGALSPSYPSIASLLYARAQLLELRTKKSQEDLAKDVREAADELASILNHAGFPGKQCVEWLSTPPIDAADALARASRQWPEVASAWREICPPPINWPRLDRMRAAAEVANEIISCRSSNPDVMTTCVSNAIIRRPHDSASALERDLRDAGIIDAYPMTRGADLRSRLQDFMSAIQESQHRGFTVLDALIQRRQTELATVARTSDQLALMEHEVRKAAGSLVIDPAASLVDLPPPVANLARAVVREVGPNIRIVDPDAARLAFRTAPPREPDAILDERKRWASWHMRAERMKGQQR